MSKMPGRSVCRGAFFVLSFLALLVLAGCGEDDGPSEAEKIEQAKKEAVAAIKAAGGTAKSKQYPQGEGWIVSLSGLKITDELCDHLATLKTVTELDLSKSTISNRQVRQLKGTFLKLNLSGTGTNDSILSTLASFGLLMELNLKGTKVTDSGVKKFKKSRKENNGILVKNTKIIR